MGGRRVSEVMRRGIRSQMKDCVWLICGGIMLCALGAAPSKAEDRIFVPVEIGQGIIFESGLDPYTFSAQLHPCLGFGTDPRKLFVGGSVAATYANPDWKFLWGGRLALHLKTFKKKPVGTGPSLSYATSRLVVDVLMDGSELGRLTGGLVLDIWHGALQITPKAGYDYARERPLVELALGFELFPH